VHPKIKVVIPSYESQLWLENTLASVEVQTYKNFEAVIIDDASPCEKNRELIRNFCKRKKRWSFHFNEVNKGSLANIIHGFEILSCGDNDIVVILDGDDWLAHSRVLERIAFEYSYNHIFFTYGQCSVLPFKLPAKSYTLSKSCIQNCEYRDQPWIYVHLRTFLFSLWKHIRKKDLLDPRTNQYWKVTGDAAWIFPILELSGGRVKYIPDILYVYNRANPMCDAVVRRSEQQIAAEYIRQLDRYESLFDVS
jgi:glycosyltransferase involved in cell wall biosynthesis